MRQIIKFALELKSEATIGGRNYVDLYDATSNLKLKKIYKRV